MSKRISAGLWRIDVPAVIVALVLTGVAGMAATRPILAARAEAASALSDLDEAVAQARKVRQDRIDLEAAAAAMNRELGSRVWKPEPVSELNQRLARITAAAVECGLKIDQLTPGVATPAPRYTAVAMRLAARGEFRAASAFLAKLRGAFPDTGVVGLRASANAEQGTGNAEFAVDLVWFASPAGAERK